LVDLILAHGTVHLDASEPTNNGTPLGWAIHGSVHRRAPGADYVAVVDRMVAAGADISAVGNVNDHTLLSKAEGNPDVQAALRRHGAR
jgi:hypothetical protein